MNATKHLVTTRSRDGRLWFPYKHKWYCVGPTGIVSDIACIQLLENEGWEYCGKEAGLYFFNDNNTETDTQAVTLSQLRGHVIRLAQGWQEKNPEECLDRFAGMW